MVSINACAVSVLIIVAYDPSLYASVKEYVNRPNRPLAVTGDVNRPKSARWQYKSIPVCTHHTHIKRYYLRH